MPPSLDWTRRRLTLGAAALAFGSVARAEPDVLARPALRTLRPLGAAFIGIACRGRHVVAVGEQGVVLVSQDGGEHWRQAEVPVSVALTAVRIASDRVVWAVGHGGTVLRSGDGGQTWTLLLDGRRAASTWLGACRAGDPDAGTGDAALNDAQRAVQEGPDKPFLDLHVRGDDHVTVLGAFGLAFETTDGGRQWRPVMGRLDNREARHLYAIAVAGERTAIVGEQGLVLLDAGGSGRCRRVETPYKGTYFGAAWVREGGLLVYGLRGNAHITHDLGRTWQAVHTGTDSTLTCGVSLSADRVLLLDETGLLLHSRDGGRRFDALQRIDRSGTTGVVQVVENARLLVSSLRGVGSLPIPAVH